MSASLDTFLGRLREARHEGDPAADALVARFRELPGRRGWAMLEAALDGRTPADAPDELEALLAPLREPPSWVDLGVVDAGAVAFWRIGSPTLFVTLTYGSLAFGYQSASLVRPLAATGRLEKMAPRRLAETTRWAVEVTAPGGMHVGAEGWRSSIRVRLVHALVRAHLRGSGRWREDAWGVPISAADQFATAIGGFYVIPRRAMDDLGVRFSPAEEEAIAQLWRWVGYVMGVPEDLLPATAARAREWIDAAIELDPGPTEDSPRLMRALLEHGLELHGRLPGIAARPAQLAASRVMAGFARRWLGGEMADRLDVPALTPAPLVPLLRPLTRARDVARATGLLGSDERVAALEIALIRRLMARPGTPDGPLDPRAAAEQPVLEAAAA